MYGNMMNRLISSYLHTSSEKERKQIVSQMDDNDKIWKMLCGVMGVVREKKKKDSRYDMMEIVISDAIRRMMMEFDIGNRGVFQNDNEEHLRTPKCCRRVNSGY